MTSLKDLFKRARSAYKKNPSDAVRKGLTDDKGDPLDTRAFVRKVPNPRFRKPIINKPTFNTTDLKCPACHKDMDAVSHLSPHRIKGYCSSCDVVIWVTTSSFDNFLKKRAKKRFLERRAGERMNPSRRFNIEKRKTGY